VALLFSGGGTEFGGTKTPVELSTVDLPILCLFLDRFLEWEEDQRLGYAVMQWKKDLEDLIRQTKALVSPSVDAIRPASIQAAPKAINAEPEPIKPVEKFDVPEQPLRLTPPFAPMQWRATSREEIKQRVASFKAHQQKFERDREDYCLQTLARTRAALEKRLEE
jgi:hypothetical protein